MRRAFSIAVIPGDGIGPEVVDAAIPALEQVASVHDANVTWERVPLGADHYLSTGESMSDETFAHLRDHFDAIFLGALGDPRVPKNEHIRDILLGLRFGLDLYVNFRPCRLYHPRLCPLASRGDRGIDFVIFRENTEGMYLGRGRAAHVGTPDEEQIAEEVHTARKVRRTLEAAFAWAEGNGKTRVTLCDKSNAIPAHELWLRLFREIASQHPEIESEHRYIDAAAMEMVRDPARFQVIVTTNLFGDILSDLGAELVGGLGMAPSANTGDGRGGLFEPVHGSAPPLAGRGIANPMATILSGGLMLSALGVQGAAQMLDCAVTAALTDGVTTPDVGGQSSTAEVGAWIAQTVSRVN